jgi:hypothetical protein
MKMEVIDIHVRDFIPRLRIKIDTGALVVDTARAMLLEQTNHAGTSGLM